MSTVRLQVQVQPAPSVTVRMARVPEVQIRHVIQQVAGLDRYHRHVQSSPSAVWAVAHNLGKRPSVMVVDTALTVVDGDIEYVDDNHVEITFSAPFAGEAYLN